MSNVIKIQYGYEVDPDLKFIPPSEEDENHEDYSDPEDDFTPKNNRHDCYFIFDDKTCKHILIYEPHGWFKFKDWFVVYGHENIKIYDQEGKELVNQHTR